MLIHVACAVILSAYYRIFSESFHLLQISFFSNFPALIIASPFILWKITKLIKSPFLLAHAYRAVAYTIAQTLLVFAYNNMPFTQVSAITITYPLFVTLSAVVALKEKIGMQRSIALIIGFIGAIIIIQPTTTCNFNTYSAYALSAVILWASFDITTNKIGNKENAWDQFLQLLFFMGLFSILPAIFVPLPPTIDLNHLLMFALIGLLVIVYMLSATLAVSRTQINVIAPFYFTILPLASLVAYILFDEHISIKSVIGATIIISSTLYVAYKEYRAQEISKQA